MMILWCFYNKQYLLSWKILLIRAVVYLRCSARQDILNNNLISLNKSKSVLNHLPKYTFCVSLRNNLKTINFHNLQNLISFLMPVNKHKICSMNLK